MTFAAQPDSLPVVDARRDLDVDVALLEHAAGAVAFLARVLDELPGAVAGRTCPGAHELAEDAARDLTHAAVAPTGRAGADLRLRLRAVSSATLARNGDAERHLALRPRRHLRQVDLDPRGDVGAAHAPPSSPAEQVVAEECGEQIRKAAEVEGGRREAAAAQTRMTEAVVELPPLGVGEHLVRLDGVAEPVVGVRLLRHVGMQLAGEAPERALDLVSVRRSRHAEKLVVVALSRCHYGTARGAVFRTRGLRPCVRLK